MDSIQYLRIPRTSSTKLFTKQSTSHGVPSCGPFRMSVDLIRYLHIPRTSSTKPFTKRSTSH
ncbi:uncharacterized protein LACBIDRAFT_310088 [Laccaria bicolor S238N-H82]|uniref:Predicted protein n=1 Tax=Laccaria bicolor (strain S238N-H82 / ATCC MYA-4686) TaxID=486041 RepID=B0DTM3_LACBS|nr:uncharacterized protein LACBIDRAFT_310088 [Laccaria bicolor S238N-H82]EDR02144.1 predicted protein [Laccaria bicolor S238N-H82]|eukprot:XP_001887301.1 predicted protein [Laccaria bicolor S238N-H82]